MYGQPPAHLHLAGSSLSGWTGLAARNDIRQTIKILDKSRPASASAAQSCIPPQGGRRWSKNMHTVRMIAGRNDREGAVRRDGVRTETHHPAKEKTLNRPVIPSAGFASSPPPPRIRQAAPASKYGYVRRKRRWYLGIIGHGCIDVVVQITKVRKHNKEKSI